MTVERFVFDPAGANGLPQSEEVRADLLANAERIADVARCQTEGVLVHGEDGIVSDAYTGTGRATVIGIPLAMHPEPTPRVPELHLRARHDPGDRGRYRHVLETLDERFRGPIAPADHS